MCNNNNNKSKYYDASLARIMKGGQTIKDLLAEPKTEWKKPKKGPKPAHTRHLAEAT